MNQLKLQFAIEKCNTYISLVGFNEDVIEEIAIEHNVDFEVLKRYVRQ